MEYLKLFSSHTDYEEYLTGGTMVKPNVSYCEDVKDVHYNPWTWADEYFTIEALEDGDIKFVFGSGVTTNDMISMSYSTDGGKNWILIENNNGKTSDLETTVSVNSGDKILFKGIGNTMCHIENGTMPMPPFGNMSHFESTIRVNVMGNIMSLVFGDNYKNQFSLENRSYCFAFLCTNAQDKTLNIISAENLILPATTLANFCYYGMFFGCTSLISVPELPATTLAVYCYTGMFGGCTSLTSAPTLPATTLADDCYSSMFEGCTSLTSAPTLPATTLADDCYVSMFKGCASLITAPQLPATTLVDYCYFSMFYGCTSLTSAPTLLATTLTSSCYSQMFDGCTNLNYIKAMFTTTPSDYYTRNWVRGVASSGTFVKNSAATWTTTGVNGIPDGWTIETE